MSLLDRVILFESTRYAIRAERLLKAERVKIKVIPTPRKYSSNCGVSIAFSEADTERVKQILKEKGVPFDGPYGL